MVSGRLRSVGGCAGLGCGSGRLCQLTVPSASWRICSWRCHSACGCQSRASRLMPSWLSGVVQRRSCRVKPCHSVPCTRPTCSWPALSWPAQCHSVAKPAGVAVNHQPLAPSSRSGSKQSSQNSRPSRRRRGSAGMVSSGGVSGVGCCGFKMPIPGSGSSASGGRARHGRYQKPAVQWGSASAHRRPSPWPHVCPASCWPHRPRRKTGRHASRA